MKKQLAILATLAVAATGLLVACDAKTLASITEDPVVYVSGSSGLKFSGSVGSINSTSVQGTVPASFSVKPDSSLKIVTAVIQKKDATGSLTVEIKKGGTVVETGSTTADYGVVTVSHSF